MAPQVSTFLWLQDRAVEAAAFYRKVFPEAREVVTMRPGAASHAWNKGDVIAVTLDLLGHRITLFNGGPAAKLTFAASIMVEVETQAEIDRLWEALTADGGAPSQCGWLTDKFGVSWQIVPRVWREMLNSPDEAAAARYLAAMMTMTKFDLAAIQRAYDGR
jgi:predicted 3-demethylubiquinone-9 3-methyltransferase (glyoxalase superfamily)